MNLIPPEIAGREVVGDLHPMTAVWRRSCGADGSTRIHTRPDCYDLLAAKRMVGPKPARLYHDDHPLCSNCERSRRRATDQDHSVYLKARRMGESENPDKPDDYRAPESDIPGGVGT